MVRGTTATNSFKIPIPADMIKAIELNYEQGGTLVLCKDKLEDFTFTDDRAVIELTQEDTLRFNDKQTVEIQMRILTTEDKVIASRVTVTTVHRLLGKGGVIK